MGSNLSRVSRDPVTETDTTDGRRLTAAKLDMNEFLPAEFFSYVLIWSRFLHHTFISEYVYDFPHRFSLFASKADHMASNRFCPKVK